MSTARYGVAEHGIAGILGAGVVVLAVRDPVAGGTAAILTVIADGAGILVRVTLNRIAHRREMAAVLDIRVAKILGALVEILTVLFTRSRLAA